MFKNRVFSSKIILYLIFLFPAVNAISQEIDYYGMIEQIDSDLDSVLKNSCSIERKKLCNTIKNFRDGVKVEFKQKLAIYLGVLHSGDRRFQKIFHYNKSFGLLYVNEHNNSVEVSFEVLLTESKLEKQQILNYNDSISKDLIPQKNKLTSFLAKNSREQLFAKCELVDNTYICSRRTKKDSLIFIRYNSGYMYVYSLGMVQGTSGKFNNVHGFHLTEIKYSFKS